jgi:hypothetical protein
MLRSFHDGKLVTYEVNCEGRRIKLSIRPERDQALHHVIFEGVQGYHLEQDAFGNVIAALKEIPVGDLIADQAAVIAEAYRMAGAPGPWAADLATATQVLIDSGVRGFELSSSYGLSGWILAVDVRVVRPDSEQDPSESRFRSA